MSKPENELAIAREIFTIWSNGTWGVWDNLHEWDKERWIILARFGQNRALEYYKLGIAYASVMTMEIAKNVTELPEKNP